MKQGQKNARRVPVITDLDTLVPADHLLHQMDRVMDCVWLYEKLSPYYCHVNGRPGTDPVVLIKRVLITSRFECVKFIAMDAGCKTPWIAKKIPEDGRIPSLRDDPSLCVTLLCGAE